MLRVKRPIDEKRALTRLVVFKLIENWQIFYDKYQDNKRVKIRTKAPKIAQVYLASDSIYKAYCEHINEWVKAELNRKKQGNSYGDYEIKRAMLKEVMGKNTNRAKNRQKRPEIYESLAIYAGFETYQDFQKLYQIYQQTHNIAEAFKLLASNQPNYLEQVSKLFEEYQSQIKYYLPAEQEKRLQKSITIQVRTNKAIKDFKVAELMQLAAEHQAPLKRLHQVIYEQDESFSQAETILHKTQLRRRRLMYALNSVLILLVLSFFTWTVLSPQKLTQIELHNIKHKIISIDQSPLGHATVHMAYDASHIGKTLEGKGIVLRGGRPFIKKEISKSMDTLSFIYERGGLTNYDFGVAGEDFGYNQYSFILPLPDWTAYVEANDETGKHLWNSKQRQKSESMDNGHLRFQYPIKEKYRNYYSSFYSYAKPIAASLNDFKIEIRAKLLEDSLLNGTCFHNNLTLASEEEDFFGFQMLIEGCSKWVGLTYGHATLREKKENLQGFICPKSELFDWHTVRVQVKNRILTYTFNGRKIYSRKIPKLKGGLDAIQQNFKGMGMLDYVRVWNGKGKLVYEEEFEE